MNPRLTTAVVGAITLVLGVAGLLHPMAVSEWVLRMPIHTSLDELVTRGEVRATYGGIFVVLGVYTLLSAANPGAQAGRLLFIALLWLGACAGRLLGAVVDGSPGLRGWLFGVFELLMGGALVLAAVSSGEAAPQPAVATPTAPPPAAQA